MFGSSSSKGFDATKLKATLRLANSRFDVAKNKKSALMKQNMREIALLLAEEPTPKEEKARIRTERLIKDDFLIEAYEILQLECQLLTERVQLLKHCKTGDCPPDLVGCVSDLIYAAPYVEIPELQEIRKQLVAKFGKQFAVDADSNKNGVVSARIVEKLSLAPPTAYMVENYMTKIAKLHEVKYEPTIRLTLEEACEPIAAPVGYSVPSSVVVTGLAAAEDKTVSSSGSTPPTNPSLQKSLSPTVVQALAYPTAPTAPSAPTEEASAINHNNGAYDEPDIFVPTIPTVPRGFSSTNQDATIPTAPRGVPSMDNNDDDGDDAIEITLDEHKEASSLSVVVEPATEEEEEENIAVNKSELYNAMTGLSSTPTVTVIKSEERDNRDTEEETIIARSHDFGSDAAATKKDIDKVTIEESQTPTSNLKEQQVMMKDESQSSLAALRARFQLLGNTPVVNDEKKKEHAKIKAEEEEEAKLKAAEQAKLKVEEELRLKAEEEAKLKAEEEARIQAEEEMRLRAEEEARLRAEEEAKLKAEEEARLKAEQEAWRKAEEEAKRKAEEEAAEEERVMLRAQEEAERRAQEEAKEESQSESRNIDDQTTLDRSVAQSDNQEGDLLAATTPPCEVKNDPLVDNNVDEKENMGTAAPKKKDDPDYTTGAALAGAAIGFATVGSVVGGLVGAAGVAHLAANEKGTAGDMARKCGKKVSKMTNKLVQKMHRA